MAEAETAMQFPPRLVVRVGVTGHRPPRVSAANQAGIREAVCNILLKVCTTVTEVAGDLSVEFRIVSSLAEGADRIVAQAGLDMGFSLECPLPASRCEYEKDFADDASKTEFKKLLKRARTVFELDGKRDKEWLTTDSYRNAGRMVAGHCDLLLAIWDGKPGEKGGTAEIAGLSVQAGVPVLHIEPDAPHRIFYLSRDRDPAADWAKWMAPALRAAFVPPRDSLRKIGAYGREDFIPKPGSGFVAAELARAEKGAGRNSKRYRASYQLKYSLSALAVLFAVLGMVWEEREKLFTLLELGCIVLIFAAYIGIRALKCHGLWLERRMLTEQFRVFEFLEPLGQSVPSFRPPPFWASESQRAWLSWYFRARVRELGLPNVCADPAYVAQQRANILNTARGQLRHHGASARKRGMKHRDMERFGLQLFGGTFFACILHLYGATALGALTAILPAFGAASEGLNAQAEWHRLAERSEGMCQYIEQLVKELEELPVECKLSDVAKIASSLAEVMTSEASEWNNLIHAKPIGLA